MFFLWSWRVTTFKKSQQWRKKTIHITFWMLEGCRMRRHFAQGINRSLTPLIHGCSTSYRNSPQHTPAEKIRPLSLNKALLSQSWFMKSDERNHSEGMPMHLPTWPNMPTDSNSIECLKTACGWLNQKLLKPKDVVPSILDTRSSYQ